MTHSVFTVDELCEDTRISRGTLYNMWKRGEGPAVIKIGSRTLISKEAAAEWRRKMENQSTQAA